MPDPIMLPTTSAVVATGPSPRTSFEDASACSSVTVHPIGRSRLISGSTCLPMPWSFGRRTRLPALNSAKLT
jgi:hypothetical protein